MKRCYLITLFVFLISLILFSSLSHCQRITPVGIELIKHYEGYSAKAYYCVASVLTIAWGHTKGVHRGQVATLAESEMFLKQDIREFEDYVNKKAKRTLYWHERDALVSLTFNAGYRLKGQFLDAVNLGNPQLAMFYLRQINKAKVNGVLKILPGLVKRRHTESVLYQDGILAF